jgi:hypothetical protein
MTLLIGTGLIVLGAALWADYRDDERKRIAGSTYELPERPDIQGHAITIINAHDGVLTVTTPSVAIECQLLWVDTNGKPVRGWNADASVRLTYQGAGVTLYRENGSWLGFPHGLGVED